MRSSSVLAFMGAAAAAALVLPGSAMAQSATEAYLTAPQSGGVIVRNSTNLCWRTSQWTPARAIAECDPDLAPKPAAKPAAAPAPAAKPAAPAAPKPAAKPAEKPKPKKPQMMPVELKLSLQGDTVFEFGKSALKDSGKKEVDDFMNTWKGVTLGAIIVTGHTDRLGSEKGNKKLSEDRAKSVKDYLVSKGVDQKLIFWEGKSSKNPVPVTKFCDNKMKRKQLIDCLQPNRRVDVEVVGTKPKPEPKPKAKPEAAPKPKAKP